MTGQAPEPGAMAILARKTRSALFLVRHHGRKAGLRLRNLGVKQVRHNWARSRRLANRTAERAKNIRTTTRNLARFWWRRVTSAHKPLVRRWRRAERQQETFSRMLAERRVLREIGRTARRGTPLIVGPWLSEVGFETLYWVPFLRWVQERFDLDPRDVIAISRGGVGAWYSGIAETYVELFDVMAPAEFARRNQTRQAEGAGIQKQMGLSPLDRELIDYARKSTGAADAQVFHPALMYGLFREFWLGNRPLAFLQDHVAQRPWSVPAKFDLSLLPRDYVAVKLYTALSLPSTEENRVMLRSLVHELADKHEVVLLDTGIAFDDHDDYLFEGHARVHTLRNLMTPANNLGVQTEVIARARSFVSTCGGLAWVSPLMGVPTVALFSDAQLLRTHLYYARTTYLNLDAAPFQTLDVRGLQALSGLNLAERVGHR